MTDVAIRVENLGKMYKLGGQKSSSFRESITNFFRRNNALARQSATLKASEFWALKDVNFEIKQGEAVGIIGRNGAGKSTLLKILSRITEPTKGRFEVFGRVSSLLEVGTGFHEELTGRENVYMNGTILGMRRAEIKAKFDEIVNFSGVEKFIDTPVKHYSSGMKVRLAFAVAAHLEPEILIIDEVLAVGDSVFQAKCIDKMTEVANSGRTILFVSHNMQAVRNLCETGISLQEGKICECNPIDIVVKNYLLAFNRNAKRENYLDKATRKGNCKGGLRFQKLIFDKEKYIPGDNAKIILKLESDGESYRDLLFGVNLIDSYGNNVLHLSNLFINKVDINFEEKQLYNFFIPNLNLRPDKYSVQLFLRANEDIQDWIEDAAILEIEEGNVYGFNNSKMIQGQIQPEFHFESIYEKEFEELC